MLLFLCNPFNDPNDPWYYVIGVLFLLLIFGALALYIILSGKKRKSQDNAADEPEKENPDETLQVDNADEPRAEVADEQADQSEQTSGDNATEQEKKDQQ